MVQKIKKSKSNFQLCEHTHGILGKSPSRLYSLHLTQSPHNGDWAFPPVLAHVHLNLDPSFVCVGGGGRQGSSPTLWAGATRPPHIHSDAPTLTTCSHSHPLSFSSSESLRHPKSLYLPPRPRLCPSYRSFSAFSNSATGWGWGRKRSFRS